MRSSCPCPGTGLQLLSQSPGQKERLLDLIVLEGRKLVLVVLVYFPQFLSHAKQDLFLKLVKSPSSLSKPLKCFVDLGPPSGRTKCLRLRCLAKTTKNVT